MARTPSVFRPPWLPAAETRREYDNRRGSAGSRGYDGRWRKARLAFLAKHPLCSCCMANGCAHPAAIVDHIKPHNGDMSLFWDSDNWQPLCKWCHDNVKQALEFKGAINLRLDYRLDIWLHPSRR